MKSITAISVNYVPGKGRRGCVQADTTPASDYHAGKTIYVNESGDMGERGCWTKEQNKSESSLFGPERIEGSDFINALNLIHCTANRFQV